MILFQDWLLFNKLSININKTKFMIFTVKHYEINDHILLNRSCIEHVRIVKYLGLYLDDKLSFSSHIDFLCSKLSYVRGIMFSIKNNLPIEALRSIYFSLSYSHLLLHNTIWGGATLTTLSKLQIAQNKIARLLIPNPLDITTNEIYNYRYFVNKHYIYIN